LQCPHEIGNVFWHLTNKKGQLSLTNLCNTCETFARFM